MTTENDLRADIEQHRLELADTVDALAAKLDVKTRLRPYAAPATAAVAALVALLVWRRRS